MTLIRIGTQIFQSMASRVEKNQTKECWFTKASENHRPTGKALLPAITLLARLTLPARNRETTRVLSPTARLSCSLGIFISLERMRWHSLSLAGPASARPSFFSQGRPVQL